MEHLAALLVTFGLPPCAVEHSKMTVVSQPIIPHMQSSVKPPYRKQRSRWRRWLVSNTQEVEIVGAVILTMTVPYVLSGLWRNYVLTNGLSSIATIQEVRSKDIVITYKVGTQLHRVTLSQPYPTLSVGERFEMRYNKYWPDDAVVLFWRPLLNTATLTLLRPTHVTEVLFKRGNVVEVEYSIEGKQLSRYLCLPPDFDMTKLQEITLSYDALNPRRAYYLTRASQQN
jgi:hypothetical protein